MPKVSIPRARIADGSLPPVCMVCGDEAIHRRFPALAAPSMGWVFAPLIGLFVFWVHVLLKDRGTSSTGFPFCERHRHYWVRRSRFIVIGFASLLIIFAFAGLAPDTDTDPGWMVILFGLAAGCWMPFFLLAFLVVHLRAVRPVANNLESVAFARVSEAFGRELNLIQRRGSLAHCSPEQATE